MTVLDSFNPLHCGAVVASWWAAFAHLLIACGFNPLHCGAVVASPTLVNALRRVLPVSIPFIAGQWSLQRLRHIVGNEPDLFQSPSLRGSGRFRIAPRRESN